MKRRGSRPRSRTRLCPMTTRKTCSTIGAFGPGPRSCRLKARGACGCCSRGAASARRAAAPNGCAGKPRAARRPVFEPSKRQLTWPNGAIATLFSADEPDRLRGPQFDAAWCDELAAWRYPQAWDMLMMGLRLGQNPRVVVTSTPKPVKLIRALLASPDCAVTRGGTRENAKNLAPGFLEAMLKQYYGTRLGRQELDAELLEDMPGALWSRDAIERARVEEAPVLRRVVVAIDPAASAGEEADETGIIVAALGQDGHGYVLDDLSGRFSPHDWA